MGEVICPARLLPENQGSVPTQWPGFRDRCVDFLDEHLCISSPSPLTEATLVRLRAIHAIDRGRGLLHNACLTRKSTSGSQVRRQVCKPSRFTDARDISFILVSRPPPGGCAGFSRERSVRILRVRSAVEPSGEG